MILFMWLHVDDMKEIQYSNFFWYWYVELSYSMQILQDWLSVKMIKLSCYNMYFQAPIYLDKGSEEVLQISQKNQKPSTFVFVKKFSKRKIRFNNCMRCGERMIQCFDQSFQRCFNETAFGSSDSD